MQVKQKSDLKLQKYSNKNYSFSVNFTLMIFEIILIEKTKLFI